MKKRLYLFSFICVFFFNLNNVLANPQEKPDSLKRAHIGVEVDILPYLGKGANLGLWYGFRNEKFRIRAYYSDLFMPRFYLLNGIKENHLEVYAFCVDYYVKKEFKGFWISTSLSYWKGFLIERNTLTKAKFTNPVISIGGGYFYKIVANFYVTPWVSFHYVIGNLTTEINGTKYKRDYSIPELSFKFGYYF